MEDVYYVPDLKNNILQKKIEERVYLGPRKR